MIGRGLLVGVATIVLVGLLFGQRSPDAISADPVRAAAVERRAAAEAEDTHTSLTELADALRDAIAEARSGAAATMAGQSAPGPRFAEAANRLADAQPLLDGAHANMERLDGTLRSLADVRRGPVLGLSAGELSAMAAELRATADSADEFVAMRLAAEGVLAGLQEALIAIGDDEPESALASVSAARRALGRVVSWDPNLSTLPIWSATIGRLLEAAGDVAAARLADDEQAIDEAGREYAAASEQASLADRALAVAIADGGAAIVSDPLGRLAAAISAVEEARQAVAPLMDR